MNSACKPDLYPKFNDILQCWTLSGKFLLTCQRHKVICKKFTLSPIQNESSEAEEACPRPVSEGFQ